MNEHLAICPACQREWDELSNSWQSFASMPEEEPGPGLRQKFYTQLEQELAQFEDQSASIKRPVLKKIRNWSFLTWQPAWQFATTVLLLGIGFTAGYFYQRPGHAALEQATHQAESMRQELSLVMLDRSSAGERLQGVRTCAQLNDPGEAVIHRLLTILSGDENIQVRLAAVDALYLFGDQPHVRQGVTLALQKQESPLMQVALIDLLVAWREKQAVDSFKALAGDGRLDAQVQTRAKEGLEKLL